MKKKIILSVNIILALFAVLQFSGCTEDKPYIIGVVNTFSGIHSDIGTEIRNAALIAAEEINASGGINGRRLQLIIKDDQANLDIALQADKEIIGQGAVAVIGHYLSNISLGVIPLFNKKETLLISGSSLTALLSEKDDYCFRMLNPIDVRAQYLGRIAYEELGLRNVAIIYDTTNTSFSESYNQYFSLGYMKAGGQIAFAEFFDAEKENTYRDVSMRVKDSGADGVMLINPPFTAALLCQNIREQNPGITIIDSAWAASTNDFYDNGGEAVNGVYFLTNFQGDSQEESFLDFRRKYTETYEENVTLHTVMAYETVYLLAKALELNPEGDSLKETILGMGAQEGLFSSYRFNDYGDAIRPLILQKIIDRKPVTIRVVH